MTGQEHLQFESGGTFSASSWSIQDLQLLFRQRIQEGAGSAAGAGRGGRGLILCGTSILLAIT